MLGRTTQLAELLNECSADDIEECEVLKDAFRNYLVRCHKRAAVHDLFSRWLRRLREAPRVQTPEQEDEHVPEDAPERTPDETPEHHCRQRETHMVKFFTERRLHGKGNGKKRKRNGDIRRCLEAVRRLELATEIQPKLFENFWFRARHLAMTDDSNSRYHRLMVCQGTLQENSIASEAARRFLLIYTHHEIHNLMLDSERRPTAKGMESRLAAATREFAKLSQSPESVVTQARLEARPYLELAERFGLGVILMAGTESRDLWRKITNEELDWIGQYCAAYLPQINEKAQSLSSRTAEVILTGLSAYGATEEDLWHSESPLSKCFKRDCASPNAMDTLAAVALGAADNLRPEMSAPCAEQSGQVSIVTHDILDRALGAAPLPREDCVIEHSSLWPHGSLDRVQLPPTPAIVDGMDDTSRIWLNQRWGDFGHYFVPDISQEADFLSLSNPYMN